MNVTKKLIKFVKDPDYRWYVKAGRGLYDTMPDKAYLSRMFKYKMGYDLDLDAPKTYNEKLQWLKLYDRDPIYTSLVDKVEVKKIVAKVIGEEYIIPTLGVWDDPDEIDFEALPNRFVLKCNHNSGTGMYICKDKSQMDVDNVKKNLRKGLHENKYLQWREWPYKNVKRKIIAEQFMEDDTFHELRDYKFFCFNGDPKILFVATERQEKNKETKFDFFDSDYSHLPITNGHPNADTIPQCPSKFEEMKQLAAKLSHGIPHVRVDFYEVNGHVYFGELTFSHWGGFVKFEPSEWDRILGDMIQLPDVHLT